VSKLTFILAHATARSLALRAVQEARDGYQVTIGPVPKKRSNEANRFYRAMLSDIEEQSIENGRQYSADVWHEFHKQEFIGIIDLPNGKQIGQTSTDLDPQAFSDFCDKVAAYHSNKYGVVFTEPREQR
jgi:hypothetical protein